MADQFFPAVTQETHKPWANANKDTVKIMFEDELIYAVVDFSTYIRTITGSPLDPGYFLSDILMGKFVEQITSPLVEALISDNKKHTASGIRKKRTMSSISSLSPAIKYRAIVINIGKTIVKHYYF